MKAEKSGRRGNREEEDPMMTDPFHIWYQMPSCVWMRWAGARTLADAIVEGERLREEHWSIWQERLLIKIEELQLLETHEI
jgi:hypothetical protein